MVLINISMYWSLEWRVRQLSLFKNASMQSLPAFSLVGWLSFCSLSPPGSNQLLFLVRSMRGERCEGVWRCRVTGVQSVPLRLRHSEDNKYHVVTSVRVWAGAGAGGVKRIYDHQGLRKQLVVLLKKSWSGSEVFWEVLMLLKIVTLVLFHRREDWREVGLVQSVIDSQRVIYSANDSTVVYM